MSLDPRAIIKAIKETSTAEEAAELISKWEKAKNDTILRNQLIQKLRSDTEHRIRELMKETLCDHPILTYHADPSGGSDSSERCLVCGEWITEKRVRFT